MDSEIQPAPEPEKVAAKSSTSPGSSSSGSHSLSSAAALLPALLASSCCIPQLVLNLFSFGCAGFAVLTPFRPFFLALTAIGVAAAAQRNGLSRRTLVLALLSWAVAYSDVAVRQYNEGALQKAEVFGRPLPVWLQTALQPPQWVPQSQLHTRASPAHALSPPPGTAAEKPTEATVIMTALNIKCTACGSRIKNGLKTKFGSHLKSVDIQEKSRAVVVRLSDQAAVTDQALLAAMNELESPATFVRRDIHRTQ